MPKKPTKPIAPDPTAQAAVDLVSLIVHDKMRWIFRQLPTSDVGIDGLVEVVSPNREATGKLLGIQIKGGESILRQQGPDQFVFYPKSDHAEYWREFSLPVLLFLVDLTEQKVFWQRVTEETLLKTEKGWKMLVPRRNLLGKGACSTLEGIAENVTEYERRLAFLTTALPWMIALKKGRKIRADINLWVNKMSGRKDITLIEILPDGKEDRLLEWSVIGGSSVSEAVSWLFPWADWYQDQDYFNKHSDEADEWDDEDEKVAPEDREIRPYATDIQGEVDAYRLTANLSKLGKAFILLDKYLSAK